MNLTANIHGGLESLKSLYRIIILVATIVIWKRVEISARFWGLIVSTYPLFATLLVLLYVFVTLLHEMRTATGMLAI